MQLEQSRRAWCERRPASRRFNPRLPGPRIVDPDDPTLAIAMRPQETEWIVQARLEQQLKRRIGYDGNLQGYAEIIGALRQLRQFAVGKAASMGNDRGSRP